MLHDFLLALLGIEGDLVTFDKSGAAILTLLAKSFLQDSEISLVETKILAIATLAGSLRNSNASASFYQHAWNKSVSETVSEFEQDICAIEQELLCNRDLSIAFFARRLQSWEQEFTETSMQGAKVKMCSGTRVVDVAFDLSWTGKTAARFRKFSMNILSRQILAFCVYGEIVGDFCFRFVESKFDFEAVDFEITKFFTAANLSCLKSCARAAKILRMEPVAQATIRRDLWDFDISSIKNVLRAAEETRTVLSSRLRQQISPALHAHFTKILNLFLCQDGALWQNCVENGDFARQFNDQCGYARMNAFSSGFAFLVDFSSPSRGFQLIGKSKFSKGPVLCMAEGGSARAVVLQNISRGFQMICEVEIYEPSTVAFGFDDIRLCISSLGEVSRVTMEVREKVVAESAEIKISPKFIFTLKMTGNRWQAEVDGLACIDHQLNSSLNQDTCVSVSCCLGNLQITEWKLDALTNFDKFPVLDRNISKHYIKIETQFPINWVVTENSIEEYNAIWRFLFSLKRVEWELKRLWYLRKDLDAKSWEDLWITRRSMLFFISTFMSFIQRDIISVSLAEFERNVDSSADFDSLVTVHERFLATLISLMFLRNQAVTNPLVKLVEAARNFASLVTHRRSEECAWKEATRRFDANLKILLTELRECQTRFSFSHVADFLSSLDLNNFYS